MTRPSLRPDLGLEGDRELAALERLAQVGEQARARGSSGVTLGVEQAPAGPVLLGLVERDVGALHQRRDVDALLGHGDADAGLDGHPGAADLQRADDVGQQGLGDGAGGGGVHAGQGDRELVAAEPGHAAELAAEVGDPAGDGLDDPVARPGGRGCR